MIGQILHDGSWYAKPRSETRPDCLVFMYYSFNRGPARVSGDRKWKWGVLFRYTVNKQPEYPKNGILLDITGR